MSYRGDSEPINDGGMMRVGTSNNKIEIGIGLIKVEENTRNKRKHSFEDEDENRERNRKSNEEFRREFSQRLQVNVIPSRNNSVHDEVMGQLKYVHSISHMTVMRDIKNSTSTDAYRKLGGMFNFVEPTTRLYDHFVSVSQVISALRRNASCTPKSRYFPKDLVEKTGVPTGRGGDSIYAIVRRSPSHSGKWLLLCVQDPKTKMWKLPHGEIIKSQLKTQVERYKGNKEFVKQTFSKTLDDTKNPLKTQKSSGSKAFLCEYVTPVIAPVFVGMQGEVVVRWISMTSQEPKLYDLDVYDLQIVMDNIDFLCNPYMIPNN